MSGIAKGWGADVAARGTKAAARADKVRRMKAIEARGGMTKGDQAAHEHYLRAWRKFTNLQERSNSGRKISPMRPRSFAPLENQLPGYGGRTGSNWEFNGNKRVRKSMSPDRRLRYQKKIQAGTSMVGGALGLSGLGLLATRKPDLVKRSAQVTTVGAGIGGVGAFNFASIQNQESKKKTPRQSVYVVRNKKQIKNIKSGLEPVTKGATMDFGLSTVHQGENVISKNAASETRRKNGETISNSTIAGIYGTPIGAYYANRMHQGGRAGYDLARTLGSSKPAAHLSGAKAAGAAAKGATSATRMAGAAFNHPGAVAVGMLTGAFGGSKAGKKIVERRQAKKAKMPRLKQPAEVGKAYNPEERRLKRLDHTSAAMNVGAGVAAAGAGVYGKKALGTKPWDKEVPATGKMKGGVLHNAGTGLRSESMGHFGSLRGNKVTPSGFRGGLRTATKAGGLGLGAVGLAVGADRVKSYRRRNGQPYQPLHRLNRGS